MQPETTQRPRPETATRPMPIQTTKPKPSTREQEPGKPTPPRASGP